MVARQAAQPNYTRMKKAELVAALQARDERISALEAGRGALGANGPDLAAALEHIDDGFILYDAEERLVHCNDRILDFYNFTRDDVAGETTAEDLARLDMQRNLVLHEDLEDNAYVNRRLESMRAGDRTTLIPLKGDRWIEARDRHLPDGGIVSIHRDISDRREEVNVQKRLLDSIPTPLALISRRQGTFLYANPATADLLDIGVEELIGYDAVASYVNPEDRNRYITELDERGQVDGFEVEFQDASGNRIWVLLSSRLIEFQGEAAILASLFVINRRKAAEARLMDAIEHVSEGFAFFDKDQRMVLNNSKYREIYGYTEDDVPPGTALDDLIQHDIDSGAFGDPDETAALMNRRTITYGETGETFDVPLADGRWIQIRDRHTSDGGTVSIHADVTDRRRAEEELAEKEALLRVALDNMPGGIRLVDKDRRNVLFNARYAELFDFPDDLMKVGESVLEENIFQAQRGEFGEGDPETLARDWLASLKSFDEPTNWERRTKSGRTLDCRTQPTELGGYVSIITDITERKQAEQALRESEQRLYKILESSPIGATIVREDGHFDFINSRTAEMVGVSKEELLNAKARDFYADPEERDAIAERLRREGRLRDVEAQLRRADGTPIWILLSFEPTGADDDTSYFGWVYDITERKRVEQELIESKELLEKTEARMIDSIESISDAFIHYDADERLVYCNEKNKDFFPAIADHLIPGARLEDVIRVAATDGVDFEAAEDIEEYVQNRLSDFRTHRKNREQHLKDGRWLLCSEYETQEGGIVGVRTEITEQKKAEEILRQAKEQAEALANSKSDFVAVVSHEVRTPMNGVLGMARLMQDTELDDEQREYVNSIVASGDALLTILNDLLDISKLEADKLDLENVPFAPARAVEDAVAVMASNADEKGIALSCHIADDLPAAIDGDPHRLRQIMLNLVSNAIKFTSAGSVSVDVGVTEGDGDRVTVAFAITDTGAGITDEAKAKLFSPYTQGSVEVARKYGGTGLGLAICRRLADLMGGTIELDSVLGEGSTFRLILPFSVVDPDLLDGGPDGTATEADAAIGPLKVLLVEDNEINRRVAIGMLEKRGHRVEVAVNGVEALERLGPDRFDVILMDRHMPVMGGIATTRKIRAMEDDLATIPIIGVTAAANTEELNACLAAGMDACVTKPIDPAVLAAALARAMGHGDAEAPPPPASTEVQPDNGAEAPVLDPAALEALRSDYGDEMVVKLVEDFKRICTSTAAELEAAAIGGDAENLQRKAHDLKSNARTMGLMQLADLCWRIETYCIENRFDEGESLAGDVGARLDAALRALEGES